MGKYFAVDEGSLYVFTTGKDRLLSLNSFPQALGLFGAETAWRASPFVAVVEDVLHKQLEGAQIVLRLHEYERVSLPREALEAYFLDGDERTFVEKAIEKEAPTPIVIDRDEEY